MWLVSSAGSGPGGARLCGPAGTRPPPLRGSPAGPGSPALRPLRHGQTSRRGPHQTFRGAAPTGRLVAAGPDPAEPRSARPDPEATGQPSRCGRGDAVPVGNGRPNPAALPGSSVADL